MVQLVKEMQHRLQQKIAAVRGCPGGGERQQGQVHFFCTCNPVAVRLLQRSLLGEHQGGDRQTANGLRAAW